MQKNRSLLVTFLFVLLLFLATAPALAAKRKGCEGLLNGSQRVNVRISQDMSAYHQLVVNGKGVWGSSHEAEIVGDHAKLGLRKGDRIVIYCPDKSKGLDYQLYTNGLQRVRTFLGLELAEVTDGSVVRGSSFEPSRIFQLVGKTPADEEGKVLETEIEKTDALLASVKTAEEFRALPEEKLQRALIGAPRSTNKHLIQLEDVPLSNLRGKDKEFALKMKDWVNTNIEFESDRDEYVFVGRPHYFFTIAKDRSGEILGGHISVQFDGVHYYGSEGPFRNMKEALAAGGEDNDVSWQISKYFSHDMRDIGGDDMLEWTGH